MHPGEDLEGSASAEMGAAGSDVGLLVSGGSFAIPPDIHALSDSDPEAVEEGLSRRRSRSRHLQLIGEVFLHA